MSERVFYMKEVYDAAAQRLQVLPLMGEDALISHVVATTEEIKSRNRAHDILQKLVEAGFLYQPRPRLYALL